ncbi:MAG: hypothetical protein Q8903_00825 [Bacteroidota bacterium]|nr:hypothetical protein [Bacteroidota bacterium]
MTDFYVKKWYLDYVTQNLDASIIYDGSLRFGPFEYHHSSELKRKDLHISERTNWDNKFCKITVEENTITCLLKDKTVKWLGKQAPINIPIFKKNDKFINWNCVQPLSRVEIITGTSVQHALGYAEQMETNILPWEFEFDYLNWGRFTSDNNSLVWTFLDGDFKQILIFLNSKEVEPVNISLNEIEFKGGTLKIEDTAILREGNIVSSLLNTMPSLSKILPKTGFPIFETKILGKGSLLIDGRIDEGYVIHEEVKWK